MGASRSFRRAAQLLAAALSGYLLGTLPSADAASRLSTGGRADLRSAGTGNPGAMNARRLLGRRAGLAVMVADIGKGVAACLAGRALAGDTGAHTAGVAAVAGHCYPAWNGFRGGKGIATSFGQCLATFPAFTPLDVAIATGVSRLPGVRRPALASVAVSSTAWVLAGVIWWRRGLPNFWGVRPTGLLPLANAATSAVIASKALGRLLRGDPDELRMPR